MYTQQNQMPHTTGMPPCVHVCVRLKWRKYWGRGWFDAMQEATVDSQTAELDTTCLLFSVTVASKCGPGGIGPKPLFKAQNVTSELVPVTP